MHNSGVVKRDRRALDRKALEALRIEAVKRVEAGESPEDVVRVLGFTHTVIYDWLAKYREQGLDGLKARPTPGRPPKISGKQLEKLYKIITQKSPLQLKFEFALWARAMVRELIRDKFGVRMSDVSVGRLLHKMGLSPRKPHRRAYEQDTEEVQRWTGETFPAIQEEANRCNALIFFADEAGVRSEYHAGTTWAPKGKTPVIPATGQRYGLNLISAISPRGQMRFMTVEGRMNAGKFIDFLKRLMVGVDPPILLIVDGHPSHRAKKGFEFIRKTNGVLRLYFLPPYSPKLNPDELVWSQLKHHGVGKKVPKNRSEFISMTLRHIRSIQKNPGLIASTFRQAYARFQFAWCLVINELINNAMPVQLLALRPIYLHPGVDGFE